jgi:hypothetical protein
MSKKSSYDHIPAAFSFRFSMRKVRLTKLAVAGKDEVDRNINVVEKYETTTEIVCFHASATISVPTLGKLC